jgi:hypothetical protein
MAAEEGAAAAAAAEPGEFTMDLTGQFMQSLVGTMLVLRKMYPQCERTQKHVSEVHGHSSEPKTRTRSIKMWHKSMQPLYVDIAQTKDEARRNKAMQNALSRNWFFTEMRMLDKWNSESFDKAREKFVHAIRVLNGLAYMQNSFLGKLGVAIQEIMKRIKPEALSGGGAGDLMSALGSDALMDLIPKIVELINPDTLLEINRMLPHVTYVLGGKDKLLEMLNLTLGDSGSMKPVLMQVLGTLMPMMSGMSGMSGMAAGGGEGEGGEREGEAGGGGGAHGGEDGGIPEGRTAAAAAGGVGAMFKEMAEMNQDELLDKGTDTIRKLIERISDPDNEDPIGQTLGGFGIDVSKIKREDGKGPRVMDADEIKRSFQMFKDQFGDGALASVGSLISDKLSSGDINLQEITEMATSALEVNGVELGEDQKKAVNKLTATVMQLSETMGEEGAEGGEVEEEEAYAGGAGLCETAGAGLCETAGAGLCETAGAGAGAGIGETAGAGIGETAAEVDEFDFI